MSRAPCLQLHTVAIRVMTELMFLHLPNVNTFVYILNNTTTSPCQGEF